MGTEAAVHLNAGGHHLFSGEGPKKKRLKAQLVAVVWHYAGEVHSLACQR